MDPTVIAAGVATLATLVVFGAGFGTAYWGLQHVIDHWKQRHADEKAKRERLEAYVKLVALARRRRKKQNAALDAATGAGAGDDPDAVLDQLLDTFPDDPTAAAASGAGGEQGPAEGDPDDRPAGVADSDAR